MPGSWFWAWLLSLLLSLAPEPWLLSLLLGLAPVYLILSLTIEPWFLSLLLGLAPEPASGHLLLGLASERASEPASGLASLGPGWPRFRTRPCTEVSEPEISEGAVV